MTDWSTTPSNPLDDIRAALEPRPARFWTQEEWELLCWQMASPALSSLMRSYKLAWHDPKPGERRQPGALTPSIVMVTLYARTGLTGWRVEFNEQEGKMEIKSFPPRPRSGP